MPSTVQTNPGGVRTLYNATIAVGASGNGVTVPANKRWRVLCLSVDYTASATVGNRTLGVRVGNGANAFWCSSISANVVAGALAGFDVYFGVGLATNTTVRRGLANTANTSVQVTTCCPITDLAAGDTVTVDDYANIDNADSMLYRLWYVEYDL